jgi:hypothetical protein
MTYGCKRADTGDDNTLEFGFWILDGEISL